MEIGISCQWRSANYLRDGNSAAERIVLVDQGAAYFHVAAGRYYPLLVEPPQYKLGYLVGYQA